MVEIPKIASSVSKLDTKTSKSKSKIRSSHPPTSKMVQIAILSLKARRGSSLQAIKKYIITNYNLNPEKISPLIRRYIKFAISEGKLIQTKGKGASGSFKLPLANHEAQSKTSIKDEDLKRKPKVNSVGNKFVATTKSNVSIKKSITKIPKLPSKPKIKEANKKERKTYEIQKSSQKGANKKVSGTALKASTSKRNLRSRTLSKAE